ncbi:MULTISPECIES: VOC family protein [unclassified Paenibacillus]|uniref:VOC family protein n=1 Tax=unclassified Paenibacillus TaxID=185978 RepID=UPI00210AE899|nr:MULTISPECIES: VOC family protein [unclassified Paenibacillus]
MSNAILRGGGFHHVAIRVFDFEGTIRFYSDVLGFTVRHQWGEGDKRAVLLDTGDGNYLEVFAGGKEGQKPEGAFLHLALRTEDVDGVTERARAAGAEVTVEPKNVELGGIPVRLSFFKGPDGELIELFQSTGEDKL